MQCNMYKYAVFPYYIPLEYVHCTLYNCCLQGSGYALDTFYVFEIEKLGYKKMNI